METNSSYAQCPEPFIPELSVATRRGYLDGRWCHPHDNGDTIVSCCFPCPITDWRYSDDFSSAMVPWIGLAVLVIMIVSALTFIVLPVSATQRHYLTTSPLMGFIFMSIAFIIPLNPSVEYCYDAITPNYWLSEANCAASGALLLYGVWVLVIGCFFRSLSLYLQLCWDVEPGTKFRAVSIACIFVGSLAMLGIVLGVSGVSYQVGNMCYVSYPRSIGSFWGPLIGVAFISFALQLFIMAYCIRGVLAQGGATHSPDPAAATATTAVIASRPPASTRVWRILQLQWRAIAIAWLILLYVVYVGQSVLRFRGASEYPYEELKPWIDCLVRSRGDQEACLEPAAKIEPNQATVVSALALLASGGFWGAVCTVRWSMVRAWIDWAKDKKDAVAALLRGDGRRGRRSTRQSDLERVSSDDDGGGGDDNVHSLRTVSISSPTPTTTMTGTTLEDVDRLYGTRKYHAPQLSFSAPGRISALTGSTVTTTISSHNTYDPKGGGKWAD
ncbi:uncharacterized protein BJX67DRAFT_377781 [Aspergillus lucknowensis]|uniref:G-protein coupled receptors family 2 profile 2 domain-containing protein n=1 Tax=Aspergillus lucknowensis TaxID=176173 RepID=A0ABR4M3L5_9EURO